MTAKSMNDKETDKFYLFPGEIFSSKKPHMVDTILGSCVAVFLWDPVLQFASINHFMLPVSSRKSGLSCKYGNVAIPELINRMLKMGSTRNNLRAKIFGGSEKPCLNQAFSIGERNITLATTLLNDEKIPIISHSVGGNLARKVIFYSATGEVFISFIRQELNVVIDKENNHNKPNLTGR